MRTIVRRRLEGRTDYGARLNLLKSKVPRLVVRITNRYIIAQIVKSKEAQDTVVCTANSKELIKYGMPETFSMKNVNHGYLTGILIGKKAKEKKISEAILDIGLKRSTKGSKIYAVVKGCADSGIKLKYSEDLVPKISEDTTKIKEKIMK